VPAFGTDWGTEIDMTNRRELPVRRLVVAAVAALALALGAVACGGDDEGEGAGLAADTATTGSAGGTADLTLGEDVYQSRCAACHGDDLRGTERGPSQLSIVYQPSHHPDASYVAAITQGSASHHWDFGDMPPVEGLSEDEIASVIAYIRSVQDAEGFEPYPPDG
jgi:mono/diheme cytochrome c family protein